MTRLTPFFMQPAVGDDEIPYDGLDLRLLILGMWASEGVTNNGLRVSQRAAGANFSVDVAGGIAVITGNDVNLQGTYMVVSDAMENLTIPSPPVSGSRTHRVIAWVRDKLYDGALAANTYEWVLEVQPDTTGSGPDDALPDSAIALASVTVAAGQTSVTDANITDTRVSALTAPSWLQQVSSSAGRPAVPLPGQEIWRTDLLDKEIHTGSEWRQLGLNRPYAILTTAHNQNITASTTTAVNFESEVADSHNGHSTSSNISRYTVPQSGVYRVDAVVPWVGNTAEGKYEMHVRVNGSTAWVAGSTYKGTQNVTPIMQGGATVRLNAGDYIELVVWQGTGATRAIDCTFNGGPRLEVIWERAL